MINISSRVAIVLQRCAAKGSKPCSKLTTVRTLNALGAAGLNSATLTGAGLKTGSYRAGVTATDGFGRVAKPLTAGFVVTK